MLPATLNDWSGVVVPMPTFPVLVTTMCVLLAVLSLTTPEPAAITASPLLDTPFAEPIFADDIWLESDANVIVDPDEITIPSEVILT